MELQQLENENQILNSTSWLFEFGILEIHLEIGKNLLIFSFDYPGSVLILFSLHLGFSLFAWSQDRSEPRYCLKSYQELVES